MKTKSKNKRSSSDDELYKIFSDYLNEDINHAVRDAKKAFSLIKQDALYRNMEAE